MLAYTTWYENSRVEIIQTNPGRGRHAVHACVRAPRARSNYYLCTDIEDVLVIKLSYIEPTNNLHTVNIYNLHYVSQHRQLINLSPQAHG